MDKTLLTVNDLAERWSLSPEMTRVLAEKLKLQPFVVGHRTRRYLLTAVIRAESRLDEHLSHRQ